VIVMAIRLAGSAIDGLQTLFHWGAIGTWTDSQLMTLFLTDEEGSEAAFRVLIHRHGPMVLGICRRVLGDEHAAEDAFQATFLVLVKKAGGLQDCNLLSNWLYGVALRIANKEKAKGARRRVVERQASERPVETGGDFDQDELRSVIDEEIKRLPERYRVPLVLCHLEGLRHDEVAKRLGCPVGTVESRLSRAREQLRARLERRGLAPTASVLGVILKRAGASAVFPSLVEATLRVAVEQSSSRSAVGTAIASLGCLVKRMVERFPAVHARAVMSTLVLCTSIAVVGFGVFQADGEPERRPEPPPATRNPSAVAYPLRGITIDGRLDDWPKDLRLYPIRNQLVKNPSYNTEERDTSQESDAYFMVGYDREAELIYLAVVVPDDDVIAKPGSAWGTDAMEVYIDGTFSERTLNEPSQDWKRPLDASTMPVLQYAAVPGMVAAYGDPWDGNPSLLYAQTKQTATRMKYQHVGDVTTYEWAIKAYDRYPDLQTQLYSGKRLGLEVAVVDKDHPKLPPYFLTWGAPPVRFKGFDAGSLGELILVDQP
jgi:RNA polymerase sigma factor (sigma-70 family)